MLVHSRAQAAFVSGALAPALTQAMNDAPHEVKRVVETSEFSSLTARARTRASRRADRPRDDIGFWLYSSGSTGKPKGTVHTHANLYWTAELYGKPVLGVREDDVVFSAAKLFFAYGLGNALTFPLSVGATVVLMAERPTPPAVFKRLIEQRPDRVLRRADAVRRHARVARAAGARHKSSCASRVRRRGAAEGDRRALQCALRLRGPRRHRLDRDAAHLSVQPPGTRALRHHRQAGAGLRHRAARRGRRGRRRRAIGDLYINGPSAALMYWGNREKSRATFQGGWTKSGDKYVRSRDGYYTYAGRSDDMLRVSGQYVSPFEVEATLMQHPAVLEAAVIGKTDAEGLTKTKAFVVLKGVNHASAELEDELKAFVKGKLAPHKYPRLIEFVAELPKTATGKIQRFRLREKEASRWMIQ